jgi:hypothetical protein
LGFNFDKVFKIIQGIINLSFHFCASVLQLKVDQNQKLEIIFDGDDIGNPNRANLTQSSTIS